MGGVLIHGTLRFGSQIWSTNRQPCSHRSNILVPPSAICHAAFMPKRRKAAAVGIFLFLGPVAGAVYGISRGDPILWMLYGFGAGIALGILVWLVDRWRD